MSSQPPLSSRTVRNPLTGLASQAGLTALTARASAVWRSAAARPMVLPRVIGFLLTAGLGLVVSGCGPSASGGAGEASNPISVVTSTNVYGQIAESVGGEAVEVTSIIVQLNQDPHSYEATVRDKLAVSKADLVIENGGGYDVFLHRLVTDTGVDPGQVLSAVELSGMMNGGDADGDEAAQDHGRAVVGTEPQDEDSTAGGHEGHDHGAFNEHVWYSLSTAAHMAEEVAAKLAELQPAKAETFAANADAFHAKIDTLQKRLDALAEGNTGGGVAITEPVPLYLLERAGLTNKTPAELSEAVEEGHSVSPVILQQSRELLSSGSVQLLAYNEQTAGPQTVELRTVAEAAGVPVVNFTETLPAGMSYIEWMQANIANIEQALKH